MKRSITTSRLLAAAGSLVLFVAVVAWSQAADEDPVQQPPQPRQGRMMQGRTPAFAAELGLTEEQQEKLRALRLEAQKARIQARADLRVKQMELRELMRADEVDRAAISQALDQIAAMRKAQMLERLDHQQAVRSILTPEQWAKMKTLRQRAARRLLRQGRRLGGHRGFHRRGSRRYGPGARRMGGQGRGPSWNQQSPEQPQL